MRQHRGAGDARAFEDEARSPLSPMQEGMLFHHLSGGPADVDLQQILVTLPETIDEAAMREAWRHLGERHPTLRSSITWGSGDPPSRRVHPQAADPFRLIDLSHLSDSDRDETIASAVRSDRAEPFDLTRPPLFRVRLLRFGPRDCALLWSFHHILMDGRSTALVLEELFTAYETLRRGGPPALGRLAPYDDYLAWLSRRDTAGDAEFWRDALRGIEAPTPIPGARRADARPAPPGEAPRERELRLGRAETDRLESFARALGVTVNALVQAAWALTLARFAGEDDVVYGVTRAVRGPGVPASERMVGVLIQTTPVRVGVDWEGSVGDWLRGLKTAHRAVGDRYLAPLSDVQARSGLPSGVPLFGCLYMYDHEEMTTAMRGLGGAWESRSVRIIERPPYPMTLYAFGEPELLLRLAVDPGVVEGGTESRVLDFVRHYLSELAADPERPLAALDPLPASERQLVLEAWNRTEVDVDHRPTVHDEILAQGERRPDRPALVAGDRVVTFGDLSVAVRRMARRLRSRGVGPGSIVGLYGDRAIETVSALLAILKTGAAYLPLDPTYPVARLRLMVEDADVRLIVRGPVGDTVVDWGADVEVVDAAALAAATGEPEAAVANGGPGTTGASAAMGDLAYLIYTSGSTGRPKGVMVEHGNVRNFLAAMDQAVPGTADGPWLSVTPLSFDISVLELLWTLSRGRCVALPGGFGESEAPARSRRQAPESGSVTRRTSAPAETSDRDAGRMRFGLFYFAAASAERAQDGYRLLLEGAKKADEHGFSAVWTPERHFHPFGGLYPNPSVTGAALAAVTRHVDIRAGSVVLPLHDPVRVAEEWSVIDNLSGGRAGVAFASGWQKNDFVLAPERYASRHEAMLGGIEIVQRLWRGEKVFLPGVDGEQVGVELFPRPVQSALPMWLTAAGSPETFRRAGRLGAGVLTHLLGQSIDDLAARIEIYREARRAAGHGPGPGCVTVMLHTFVGEDETAVRDLVRGPLREYLRSSVSLIKNYAGVWASRKASGAPAAGDEFERLSPEDLEAILDQAFDRYFEESGLLGPREKCARLVARLGEAGVDEIACLVDFGVPTDLALAGIDALAELARGFGEPARRASAPPSDGAGLGAKLAEAVMDVPALIRRHGVRHMQCTPSLARMLLADAAGRGALANLETLLVGGEPLAGELAQALQATTPARIVNMYGPTETTVWSTVAPVNGREEGIVPIGRPIANTRVYVLDGRGTSLPAGAPGELYIGGAGVARGYHGREDLTAERFVPDPFDGRSGARLYRTGDRVRWRADGTLEFLGRTDRQVKLRGHRVELGEVETVLRRHPGVREVAVAIGGEGSAARLAAYYVPNGTPLSDSDLRRWAEDRLPDVMVPAVWIALDTMPLTPNGKLDRAALPEPRGDVPPVPSGSGTADAVAEIWGDVLGVTDVGPDDDFFALGGNSLSTIQVAFRIRKAFSVELPLRTFFEAPTVAALARRLEETLLDRVDAAELDRLMDELEGLSDAEAGRLAEQGR